MPASLSARYEYEGFRDGRFLLRSMLRDEEERIEVTTRLPIDAAFASKEFEVFFLIKKNVRENDIFEVHDDSRKKRIGWCIPVNALDSIDHSFAENEHFLRYAFRGIEESLSGLTDNIYVNWEHLASFGDDPVPYAGIFHQHTCLLIVSKETLSEGSLDIARVLPSLAPYGYLDLSTRNPSEVVWEACVDPSAPIKFKPVASAVGDTQVILSLIQSAISYESRPVFRFFYLYQIIEYLMDDLFKIEQGRILDELRAHSVDVATAKDILSKLQEVTSEKKRIGLLIDSYSRSGSRLDDLKISCSLFLDAVNRKSVEEDHFKNYFYATRNYIFHQLRDLSLDQEELLSRVVNDFVAFIPHLLATYGPKSQTNS